MLNKEELKRLRKRIKEPKRCDKFWCFRPSTGCTQNMQEVQPVYIDGSWHEKWKPMGWRFGCDKHPVYPTRKHFPLSDQERSDYVNGEEVLIADWRLEEMAEMAKKKMSKSMQDSLIEFGDAWEELWDEFKVAMFHIIEPVLAWIKNHIMGEYDG